MKCMNEEEKQMVDTANLFASIGYAAWFLKSYIRYKASARDLSAFKASFPYVSHSYPKLGRYLIFSAACSHILGTASSRGYIPVFTSRQ